MAVFLFTMDYACQCGSPEFCQALIDSAPDSFSRVDKHGYTPLHWSCNKAQMDEAAAIQILEFLVEKYPAAVWHADNDASLPIHLASRMRSPEFCQVGTRRCSSRLYSQHKQLWLVTSSCPMWCRRSGRRKWYGFGINQSLGIQFLPVFGVYHPSIER